MKTALVHSISFVYEKDGEEMQVMKQDFRLGEAIIVKNLNGSEILVLKDKWKYDLIHNFCIAINYDAMRSYSYPLALCLIGFITNPGGLMIRINGVPMRSLVYQDYPTELDIEE